MAKKKEKEVEASVKEIKDHDAKSKIAMNICPACGVEIETEKCRFCGARKTINDVSGNVIWMRNGRIVRAFHDEKEAYTRMAMQYNIPRDRWPEEFRK